MAAAATKVAGPGVISGLGVQYIFTVLLDSSFSAGGEVLDLTDYFTQVYFATTGANDADADNRYVFSCVHPGSGNALTSSNFLISCSYVATGDDVVLSEAHAVELSGIGKLNLNVIGTAATS